MPQTSHRGFGSRARSPTPRPYPPTLTSAEHCTAERESERDRPRRRAVGGASERAPSDLTFVRFNSVGPQETIDWLDALDGVKNKIETIERNTVLQSTALATHEKNIGASRAVGKEISADLEQYKEYVERRFKNIQDICSGQIAEIKEAATSSHDQVQELKAILESSVSAWSATAAFHGGEAQGHADAADVFG